jgi:Flp pilus assembly protein TadB
MWAFLSNLVALLVAAYNSWREEKLRNEGRQEVVKKAEEDAKATEVVADLASTDPVVLERVRARWDRARARRTPES